ncbi:MAG: glycoside hydrolase family protein [Pseudomonadota bacterium]
MALNMRTSQAGLDVLKAFEGFRSSSERLPNGRWVIGYGHVRRAREGVRISEAEAEAILREYDLPPVERHVMRCVLAPMTQNEFDALVSLAFNIGPKAFASSDVVAHMNGGNRLDAAHAFDQWRRAKIGGRVQIVDALVRRRAAEKALFLNPPGRAPSASSHLYRAMLDSPALPAPQRQEIVVEHQARLPSPGAIEQARPIPERRSETEAAAESVRAQMVRILGQDRAAPETDKIAPDGASPEEITAAISELASATETQAVQKSVWPQQKDLPAPPRDAAEMTQSRTEAASNSGANAVIDDLESIEVSPDSIARAVEMNHAMDADDRFGDVIGALPYGLLALIGAALFAFGAANQFGAATARPENVGAISAFLPVFLMLLGGFLFAGMVYYFLRALISDA